MLRWQICPDLHNATLRPGSRDVTKRQAAVATARAEQERLDAGRPELVDLDKLNDYYSGRWPKGGDDSTPVDAFQTSVGPMTFQAKHFSFVLALLQAHCLDSNREGRVD